MTEISDTPEAKPEPKPVAGDRIAKVMARAGVASRRDAERLILEGRVAVNGKTIVSPALDVLPSDKITLDGKRIEEPQETRLWLFYKPLGLVTSEKDEKGRQTVFDALPHDLPRVMSVGRLDLNSEGLLLLTNDGELKRRLELPATGWLRRYRVRVNGQPNDLTFDPLRRGITIDGEEFQPMEVKLDSQKGANAWLTVGIREGRNREIRRAMAEVGLMVNRLIRIGYGPFRLDKMAEGELKEVRRRVLKDQLGGLLTGEGDEAPEGGERGDRRGGGRFDKRADGRGERRDGPRKPREFSGARGDGPAGEAERKERKPRHGKPGEKPFRRDSEAGGRKPYARREDGDRKPYARREDGERKPYAPREDGERKPYARREDGERKPYARREDGERKPYARREDGERKPYAPREDGERKPYARREDGERKPYAPREDGERKPYARREDGERKPYARREDGERKPYARREDGERKPYARREDGERKPYARREDGERKPYARREDGERKPYSPDGERPARRFGDKPRSFDKPRGNGEGAEKRFGGKTGGKPHGKSFGDRPSADRFSDRKSVGGKPSGGKPFGRKPDGKGPTAAPRSGPRSGPSGGPRGGKPGPKRG